MQLRKLYRTIESIASRKFESDEELLTHVVQSVVTSHDTPLKGGRIWKFEPRTVSYVLLNQTGEMDHIKKEYRIKLKDYPVFYELPKVRTVLGSEQDQYLRKRGILKYS